MTSVNKQGRCPQCRQSAVLGTDNPWRPFCSRKCKLIDFGDWLDEFGLDPEADKLPEKPETHENLS